MSKWMDGYGRKEGREGRREGGREEEGRKKGGRKEGGELLENLTHFVIEAEQSHHMLSVSWRPWDAGGMVQSKFQEPGKSMCNSV
jgi:hypothetical protein